MPQGKERPLRIYQDGNSGKFYVLIKGKKNYVKLPTTVKTLKEAQQYALKHLKAQVKAKPPKKGKKATDLAGAKRTGKSKLRSYGRVSYRGRPQKTVDPLTLDAKSLLELQRKKLMEESNTNLKELELLKKFALDEVISDQKRILDEIKKRETMETSRMATISTQTDDYDGELDIEDTKSTSVKSAPSSRPASPQLMPPSRPRQMSPLKPSFAQSELIIDPPRPPTPTRRKQPPLLEIKKYKPYIIKTKDDREINLLNAKLEGRNKINLDDLPTPPIDVMKEALNWSDSMMEDPKTAKFTYYKQLQKDEIKSNRQALMNKEGYMPGSGSMFGNGEVDRDTGNPLPALYSDEIDEYFKDQPMYSGTIASDQISELPLTLPQGFVMNLDKSNQPGSHWVSIYMDQDSIEYFDPLADKPPAHVIKDLKKFIHKLGAPTMMKMKINEIKQQHGNSHHCGYHAIRFLDDRFNGIPFPLSTRYLNGKTHGSGSNTKEGEAIIRKEFSFI